MLFSDLHFVNRDSIALEEARKRIDKEIATLVETIRVLKAQRNSLSPISTLPSEILSEIFTYQPDTTPNVESAANLKACSQVCGLWREVALGDARLWSLALDCEREHPRWAAEMLLRAKQMPLVLKANCMNNNNAMINILLAFSRISNARVIDLAVPHGMLAKMNRSFEQASSLETLRFRRVGWFPPASKSEWLARLEAPKLRQLTLDGWDVPSLHFPLLTNLTYLCLYGMPISPRLLSLLRTLEKAVKIEELVLIHIPPFSPIQPSSQTISLSRLSTLRLSGSLSVCAYMTDCLLIPSCRNLDVEYTSWTSEDISALLTKLPANLGKMALAAAPQTLGVFRTASTFSISWRTVALEASYPFPSTKPQVNIAFTCKTVCEDMFANVLPSICEALPLEHVSNLRISLECPMQISHGLWMSVLSQVPHVKVLSLRSECCKFLSVLCAPARNMFTPVRKAPFLLSRLAEISVAGAHFSYGVGSFYDILHRCLDDRRAYGLQISHLDIVDCDHICPGQLATLQTLVKASSWDGRGRIGDESDALYLVHSDNSYGLEEALDLADYEYYLRGE